MPTPDDAPAGQDLPDGALDTLPQIGERVIALLTRAARMRRPARPFAAVGTTADASEATEPIDFGDFIVPILAAVAANRGGIAALLAGRPGSWEADKLRDLLISAGCEDPEQLAAYRTEPIIIDVPLEEILFNAGDFVADPEAPSGRKFRALLAADQGYEDQRDDIDCRFDDAAAAAETATYAAVATELGAPADDPAVIAVADGRFADEEERLGALADAAKVALRRQWQARYTRYLDAFRNQVFGYATVLGLQNIPIQVHGVTDPDLAVRVSRTTDLWDTDPLAAQLYEYAVMNTPAALLVTDVAEGDTP